jgi:hypothetical protein
MPATPNLTSAQAATLAADIAANTNTVTYDLGAGPQTVQIKNTINIGVTADVIAAWYNLLTVAAFYGYFNNVPLHSIIGSIRWKRLTPSDAISVANYLQQSSACQGIQFNIQLMLGFQTTLDATQRTVVQGFADALSAVPSGVAGAVQDAGWASAVAGGLMLPQVLSRLATNVEKLLADTTAWGQGGNGASQTPGATGPAMLTFQLPGGIIGQDVYTARGGT